MSLLPVSCCGSFAVAIGLPRQWRQVYIARQIAVAWLLLGLSHRP